MRQILLVFLFSFIFFFSFFNSVQADWCPTEPNQLVNCFPTSEARNLGINLNDLPIGVESYGCSQITGGSVTPYTCLSSLLQVINTQECPASGAECIPYSQVAAPGPISRNLTGCTSQGQVYACCYGNNMQIYNGVCMDVLTYFDNQQCCSVGDSLCTTRDGENGFCDPAGPGAIACQSGRSCRAITGDTSNNGTFHCNCSTNGANWVCNPGPSQSTPQLGLPGTGNNCSPWAYPDLSRCAQNLTSVGAPDFCNRVDGGRCDAELPCVTDIDFSGDSLPVGHGEECEINGSSHNCDTSQGLICQPDYNICVYPNNSRGGLNASARDSSCVWDRECVTGIGYNQGEYNDLECVASDRVTLCDLNNVRSDCSCKFPESISCEWTPIEDPESDYYGRPAFCVSGFRTADELHASEAVFDCKDNCGGLLMQLAARLSGWTGQHVPLNGFPTSVNDEGFHYTCMTGDFDGSIKATIEDCLRDQNLLTVVGGGAGAIVGGTAGVMVPGANVVTVPIGIIGGSAGGAAIADQVANVVFQCAPTISGSVQMANGWNSCQANLRIEVDLTTIAGDLETNNDPYFICSSNLKEGSQAYNSCMECYGDGSGLTGKRIWTSIGCIEQDPRSIVARLITIGTGILGGIFLLRVLAAAFMLTTSQGDVKKTSEAKEMITQAVIGVLFVIFAVTILQFIGSDVMKIPGFGG